MHLIFIVMNSIWKYLKKKKDYQKLILHHLKILKNDYINTLQRRPNEQVTNELGVGWGRGGSEGGGGVSYLRMVDDDRDSFVFQTALLTDGDSVYRHKQLDPKQRDQNKRGLYCFPGNEQTFFKYHLYK